MTEVAQNQGELKQEMKAIKGEGAKSPKAQQPYILPNPPLSMTEPEELQARLLDKARKTKDKYRLGVIERTAIWIKNLVR